jgi:pyocin large subunit-like protein
MPLKTKGFESVSQLREHFTEHGDDLGASNAEAYERLADEFLGGEKPPEISECIRTCGHIIRYDPNTDIFGILDREWDNSDVFQADSMFRCSICAARFHQASRTLPQVSEQPRIFSNGVH